MGFLLVVFALYLLSRGHWGWFLFIIIMCAIWLPN